MGEPWLSVVIFTRDDREHLDTCLRALARDGTAGGAEVIVFDNASRDGTAASLERPPLPVTLLRAETETSFSAGNNAGLRAAHAPVVAFLNPDTIPDRALLEGACAQLGRFPDVALLGPRLRYPDGSPQSNGWHLPTPRQLLAERLAGKLREVPRGPGPLTDVGWLMGCALIGRREELLAMGGFDEAFWFHGTDLELCARAGRRGRVVRWEAGELVHVGHRQWDRARRQKSRRATAQWLLRDLTVAARALVGGLASSGRR